MANTYTSLNYHLVFSTKNRESWLIEDDIRASRCDAVCFSRFQTRAEARGYVQLPLLRHTEGTDNFKETHHMFTFHEPDAIAARSNR